MPSRKLSLEDRNTGFEMGNSNNDEEFPGLELRISSVQREMDMNTDNLEN